MTAHALEFLGVSLVVIVTPGQDTALTIRNTFRGGRAGGIATAVGVAFGQASWTLAASAGVAAVIVASEPAFVALRVLGAAYLLWLGLQALRAAVFPGRAAAIPPSRAPLRCRTALRQGLVSNLGNPKMAVFFTSLLPQFAPDGAFAHLLALGLVFCSLTLAWLSAYAVAAARAGDLLERPRVRRAVDGVTGITFVAVGARIAAARR